MKLLTECALHSIVVATGGAFESVASRDAARLALPYLPWPFNAGDLADVIASARSRAATLVDWTLREAMESAATMARLSVEQAAVSWMCLLGATAKEIALEKGLSVRTIEAQRHEALKRLGAPSLEEWRRRTLAEVLPSWRT